ncbi:GNAT family N-acetyltransferase [Alteribacter natronophilus]|uniref:GNAT family N-acetyltransferase n=1 Tax=Alteribacter natronophilus TaxID=2583810 RepID=UPI0014870DB0|nr:GNAT family N-acetyltransferase [Alteribacter natronophilus]
MMITELNKTDFPICQPMLGSTVQLEAAAIVKGNNPGRIFVNDRVQPDSALIWLGNNDGVFLIGNPENERFLEQLNPFIDGPLGGMLKGEGITFFEAVSTSEQWNRTIEHVFSHRELSVWEQRIHTIPPSDFTPCATLPEGYQVMKFSDVLTSDSCSFRDAVSEKVLESWASVEAFLNRGIGYCTVREDEWASLCFTCFEADGVHAIAVETAKAHRGKGLAQLTAERFIQTCFEKGQTPYWDCTVTNRPSVALAKKLGFTSRQSYSVYTFPL